MKRRSFLSMVSVGALAALVPKRSYFFLDGLWRPETTSSGGFSLEIEFYLKDRTPIQVCQIQVATVFNRDGIWQKFGNLPWKKVSENFLPYPDGLPFVELPLGSGANLTAG